ncbi:Hypothetical protein H16_B1329 [Cupriavidus necator H16]|uniref:Uncharacterized protein n=1 Tax=Cupriavidus necator (strain ATCC 17699 / DSM 428 / KCTC 22496 / NCIMB 10442 / H16 / Stanier 337) TaxID=381666 RepID=Q0K1K5_CUPNH|nr:Hypothetical protein H16_B1329 [Cupriavidus necator H16]
MGLSVMLNQEGCAAGWSKRCVQSVLQRKSVHEFVGFSPESDSVISFETSCTSLRNRSTPLHSVHAFLPPTHLYNVRESL